MCQCSSFNRAWAARYLKNSRTATVLRKAMVFYAWFGKLCTPFWENEKKSTTKPLWYQYGKNSKECGLHDVSRVPNSEFLVGQKWNVWHKTTTTYRLLNIKQRLLSKCGFSSMRSTASHQALGTILQSGPPSENNGNLHFFTMLFWINTVQIYYKAFSNSQQNTAMTMSFWAPNGTCLMAGCHFAGPKNISISRAQPPSYLPW